MAMLCNWFALGDPLLLAGANALHIIETLRHDEIKDIDLTKHGVPERAEILHLNFTPCGSALATLLHGNAAPTSPLPPRFKIRGLRFNDLRDDGVLTIFAVWHALESDDTTIRHLVEAAQEYQCERFDRVIVPTNIAAEAALLPVSRKALEGIASKENLDEFLRRGATYSHQLNVLLPLIARMIGAQAMPDRLRGLLNRLRSWRNDVAHSGVPETQQTRRFAAEHLCAAVFAVRYAAYMMQTLSMQ